MPRVKLFDETEILEKAMTLFWMNGYHATSIRDLVNHLGINRASIYDTYGGKKELFHKAFKHYQNINVIAVQKFLFSHEDVKEGIRNLFKRSLEESKCDADHKGCFVVNTATELLPNDKELLEIIKEHKASFEKMFFDYLSLGVQQGKISKEKDLKSIVSLIFTMQNGLKVVTKFDFEEDEMLASVETLLSLLD